MNPVRTSKKVVIKPIPPAPTLLQRKPPKKKNYNKKYRINPATKGILSNFVDSKLQERRCVGNFFKPTAFDSAPSVASQDCYQLLPEIPQGPDRGERQGNQIKITSARLEGYLRISPTTNVTSDSESDVIVRILCLSCKRYKAYDDILANWSTLTDQMFKEGPTTYPIDGSIKSNFLDVNHDLFTSHYDKRFVMNRGAVIRYPFPVVPTSEGAASMPTIHKQFRIPLKFKNRLVNYNEPSDTLPNNFAPFVVMQWAHADGTPPSSSTLPQVCMNATWHFQA